MTTIRTIDLNKETSISNRDIVVSRYQYGVDVNRIDGSYLVVEPLNEDSSYGGRVVIYAQDGTITYYNTFNRVGSLYYPSDARFDYIRRKMWISDTGNNRVLKIDIAANNADINIEDLYYPHSIVVDVNTGDVFIKGYSGNDLNYGKISHYRGNGVFIGEFIYNHAEIDSSTSSESSGLSTQSSESIVIPLLPSNRSMCFDSVRSKLWWVDGNTVYVLDVRNKQIQTQDISSSGFYDLVSMDVELKTGNAYVVSNSGSLLVVQINKDNNTILGSAYVIESRNLNTPIIIQEQNDILPFSWISEKGSAGEESTLNFTIESSSSPYFDYSILLDNNNASITTTQSDSTVYVPNKDETYYQHKNSFYVDVIAKDDNGIKEVRTHVAPDAYDFTDASEVETVFFIPKFTWR